jgi:hypothetical protein
MFTFAVVCLRLIGFYFITAWAFALPAVYMAVSAESPYDGSTVPMGWLIMASPLIGAVLIIVLSELIAALIVPRKKDESGRPGETGYLRVGMLLIGIYVIARPLSQIVSALAIGLRGMDTVLPQVAAVVVGLALVVCARFAPKLLGIKAETKSQTDVFS